MQLTDYKEFFETSTTGLYIGAGIFAFGLVLLAVSGVITYARRCCFEGPLSPGESRPSIDNPGYRIDNELSVIEGTITEPVQGTSNISSSKPAVRSENETAKTAKAKNKRGKPQKKPSEDEEETPDYVNVKKGKPSIDNDDDDYEPVEEPLTTSTTNLTDTADKRKKKPKKQVSEESDEEDYVNQPKDKPVAPPSGLNQKAGKGKAPSVPNPPQKAGKRKATSASNLPPKGKSKLKEQPSVEESEGEDYVNCPKKS